jgi:hypothetical protein
VYPSFLHARPLSLSNRGLLFALLKRLSWTIDLGTSAATTAKAA